jgi:DNA (cytosine-5)-methyltransferase 1
LLGQKEDEMTEINPSKMRSPNSIKALRKIYSQSDLAKKLGVSVRTLRRWERGEIEPKEFVSQAISHLNENKASYDTGNHKFTFIDLFAGIGGIRLGFEKFGGKCVFTSEWNKYSIQTYRANFFDDHEIAGDITKVDENIIPNHDILLAGFPCQPFSIAGVSKKNSLGRAHGFLDQTQGTLFFDVARIIAAKKPKAFLLENVKNLISHDKKNTFKVIINVLEKELGYHVFYKVINGQHFVPQHRERIIIVGFKDETNFTWDDLYLPPLETAPRIGSILHDTCRVFEEAYTRPNGLPLLKYTLSPKLWNFLQQYALKHKAKGNGFGFGMVNQNSVSRTLSARYYKDGSEILVNQGNKKNPRRLTPRECARLMGFDNEYRIFKIPVSDTQAYHQFGNAVVVPVIEAVAKILLPQIGIEIDEKIELKRCI